VSAAPSPSVVRRRERSAARRSAASQTRGFVFFLLCRARGNLPIAGQRRSVHGDGQVFEATVGCRATHPAGGGAARPGSSCPAPDAGGPRAESRRSPRVFRVANAADRVGHGPPGSARSAECSRVSKTNRESRSPRPASGHEQAGGPSRVTDLKPRPEPRWPRAGPPAARRPASVFLDLLLLCRSNHATVSWFVTRDVARWPFGSILPMAPRMRQVPRPDLDVLEPSLAVAQGSITDTWPGGLVLEIRPVFAVGPCRRAVRVFAHFATLLDLFSSSRRSPAASERLRAAKRARRCVRRDRSGASGISLPTTSGSSLRRPGSFWGR